MSRRNRYTPAERERAVRLLFDQQGQHPSQWAAIQSIAGKLGCTAETLRRWQDNRKSIRVNEQERVARTESDFWSLSEKIVS
jgi:transposase-like protein